MGPQRGASKAGGPRFLAHAGTREAVPPLELKLCGERKRADYCAMTGLQLVQEEVNAANCFFCWLVLENPGQCRLKVQLLWAPQQQLGFCPALLPAAGS